MIDHLLDVVSGKKITESPLIKGFSKENKQPVANDWDKVVDKK